MLGFFFRFLLNQEKNSYMVAVLNCMLWGEFYKTHNELYCHCGVEILTTFVISAAFVWFAQQARPDEPLSQDINLFNIFFYNHLISH